MSLSSPLSPEERQARNDAFERLRATANQRQKKHVDELTKKFLVDLDHLDLETKMAAFDDTLSPPTTPELVAQAQIVTDQLYQLVHLSPAPELTDRLITRPGSVVGCLALAFSGDRVLPLNDPVIIFVGEPMTVIGEISNLWKLWDAMAKTSQELQQKLAHSPDLRDTQVVFSDVDSEG